MNGDLPPPNAMREDMKAIPQTQPIKHDFKPVQYKVNDFSKW